MSFQVTVLESKPGSKHKCLLTKKIDANWNITPYDKAAHFRFHRHKVESFSELWTLLSNLSEEPRRCIVNAAPTVEKGWYRREIGKTLKRRPVRVFALDIDGMEVFEEVKPETSLEEIAEVVRKQLPSPFNKAKVIVQATAGYGNPKKEGAHVRLWFYNLRALPLERLKKLFDGIDSLDVSTLNDNQPIYTAAPEFSEGDDPVPERLVSLDGECLSLSPSDLPSRAVARATKRAETRLERIRGALKAAGLYIQALRSGNHDLHCFRPENHTDPKDTSGAWLGTKDGHIFVGCSHTGCGSGGVNLYPKLRGYLEEKGYLDPESDNPFPDWVYVFELAKFYNLKDGSVGVKDAFNQMHMRDGERSASILFGELGGKKVKALHWRPVEDLFFLVDGKSVCNTYRQPLITPRYEDQDCDRNWLGESYLERWLRIGRRLCNTPKEFGVFLDVLAHTLQYPAGKISFAILLAGAHRTGKDLFLKPITLFLRPNVGVISNKMATMEWGDTKAQKKMLIYEEIRQPRNQDFLNGMKTTIAEGVGLDTLNLKGGAIIHQENYYTVLAMTNHRDALALREGEANDKRWFVISSWETSELTDVLSMDELAELVNWTKGPGIARAAGYLLRRDISDFNPTALPWVTEAYREMVFESKSPVIGILEQLIEEKKPPFDKDTVRITDILDELQHHPGVPRHLSSRILAQELRAVGAKSFQGQRKIDGKKLSTPRFWVIRGADAWEKLSVRERYDKYSSVSGK